VEIGEIQIQPSHQNQGIGSRVLTDTMAHVHEQGKKVVLSVALKNERAYRLYRRPGFQKIAQNNSIISCHMTPTFDVYLRRVPDNFRAVGGDRLTGIVTSPTAAHFMAR
jgi:GNAT superfamily N-acetyltransferase